MAYNNFGNYGGLQQGFQQNFQQQPMPQPAFQQQPIPQMQPQAAFQQQPIPQIQPQAVQPLNGFTWVQGEMEAKMYPVAAGNSVLLMDSENPVAYIKTRDQSGRYLPMEVYDLVRRDTQQQQIPQPSPQQPQVPQIDLSPYVKLEDLDAILSKKVQEAVDKALAS